MAARKSLPRVGTATCHLQNWVGMKSWPCPLLGAKVAFLFPGWPRQLPGSPHPPCPQEGLALGPTWEMDGPSLLCSAGPCLHMHRVGRGGLPETQMTSWDVLQGSSVLSCPLTAGEEEAFLAVSSSFHPPPPPVPGVGQPCGGSPWGGQLLAQVPLAFLLTHSHPQSLPPPSRGLGKLSIRRHLC